VPVTHSGDADHGCGYGMAAVDHAGNTGADDQHSTISGGRKRSSKLLNSRGRSPDFTRNAEQSAFSTVSQMESSRVEGGSRMEGSTMSGMKVSHSRLDTGGLRVTEQGSHMGVATGGRGESRMGGASTMNDPLQSAAQHVRSCRRVRLCSLTNVAVCCTTNMSACLVACALCARTYSHRLWSQALHVLLVLFIALQSTLNVLTCT
jgi:hypothetical protein